MKWWVGLVLGVVAPRLATTQSVEGIVVDTAGRPVLYANVRLFADTAFRGASLAQASTDTNGRFAFKTVPGSARYLVAYRIGFHPAVRALAAPPERADAMRIVLGEYERQRAVEDSLRVARHRARVAQARARPRLWWCTSGDSTARVRAVAAYSSFAASRYPGMRRVAQDHGMPSDSGLFMQAFLRPLSAGECARFATGFDKQWGLESDTVEVYHFGRDYYLPWLGGYEGGFADADGKILGIFIIPD